MSGEVYALSVEQGYQGGEIFTVGGCKVILHDCGFLFLRGEPSSEELDEIYRRVQSSRRAILFTSDKKIFDRLSAKENVNAGRRIFFEYRADHVDLPALPEGAKICEIDETNINVLGGRITPDFSWSDHDSFLRKGKGYCVVIGDDIAAWAFSSGISDIVFIAPFIFLAFFVSNQCFCKYFY